jgi:alkane 1-monooxygenase
MSTLTRKTGFFTAFIVPALVVTGYYLQGPWNYLAIVFAFIVLPIIDHLTGVDTRNVPEHEVPVVSEDFYYRLVTYAWTYVQFIFLLWAAYAVCAGVYEFPWTALGFTLSTALVTGGIGITVAHELGHKKTFAERLYSKMLLMTVSYMHFYIEHNRGHHVSVATPDDPATARKNENFYRFWLRSVWGGYQHAWKLEKTRLERKGLSTWSIHNEMIWFQILPFLLCSLLTAVMSAWFNRFTWEVPVFFFIQSFFAFTLLELVNYVEHYGIQRKEIAPGKFERVNPLHSWNASHLLSNFFLFQLQRHSDHHTYAYKRYQVLNHHDESPQLPFGYPTMILLALIPPLWFYMMNKRLEQWQHGLLSETT